MTKPEKKIFFLIFFCVLEKKSFRQKFHDELAEIPKDVVEDAIRQKKLAGAEG